MLEQGLKWLTRQACVRNSLPQLDPEIATDPTTPCGGGGGGGGGVGVNATATVVSGCSRVTCLCNNSRSVFIVQRPVTLC